MTITRSDCRYYIKEIKDLAKNFDDKIECYLLGENDPVIDSILEKIEALSDVCDCNNQN